MPIWSVAPVEEDPEIVLIHWCVVEFPNGDRHFVGYNTSGREGRVSSLIVSFDPEKRCGVTQSGRVYSLSGPTGRHGDAQYVFARWCSYNAVKPEDATMVDLGLGPEVARKDDI